MKLSIVASMYRSAPYLHEFCYRCRMAAQGVVGDDFEIVLVNDDDRIDSLRVALELREQDARIVVVDLSRNFGHHKAMMTGLMHARGERVFLIDCDLEEPPEVIAAWWARLDQDPDLDVVYGVQPSRKGKLFEKVSGWIFYRIINAMSQIKLPTNTTVARLMTSRYVRALIEHKDQEMYLFGLLAFTGFRQEGAELLKRDKRSSTYTFWRRLTLFVNALTSFSNFPLYAIFYVGTGVSVVSLFLEAYVFVNWLIHARQNVVGWASLILSIWFVGGIILMSLGVIGIYLAKIFNETKPRPFTVIRKIYSNANSEPDDALVNSSQT